MAWEHLSITKSHWVYLILGGFTSLFMLCSSIIKERAYIGEATVAAICGVIFGPHVANVINPFEWGNTDEITIEFSRIVLVVQCFAVGVELPKFYMERHWRSVFFLLVPVMAAGWLVTSLIIFLLIPHLGFVEALVIGSCVTATDPVLASSIVGNGKFARRVPQHLRHILSAESGCNDGMAFPFVFLALYLIQYHNSAKSVTYHWLVFTIIYSCLFGCIYGFLLGYFARHGIRYAHERGWIDRESFLAFYFVLGLFCAGSGSMLGLDDLLVGFACGVGFSNDGWFGEKTKETHVSNVIDLLLNLSYFVYFGTIIPWELYNDPSLGLDAWRLVCIALLVLVFRRIPAMLMLKPLIPDLKNWREAVFAGHFGPIGVGAIYIVILARAELEHHKEIPLDKLPTEAENPHARLIQIIWPIVTFLVIASIIVHGSSVAVFTLGKRINTLSITMSYTKDVGDDGPDWLRRLPRITTQSKSQAKSVTSNDDDEPNYPPGTLPFAHSGSFLRRKPNESKQASRASSIASRRRRKKGWEEGMGPGGPVSQSAIFPQRMSETAPTTPLAEGSSSYNEAGASQSVVSNLTGAQADNVDSTKPEAAEDANPPSQIPDHVNVFQEGGHLVIEDSDGEVIVTTDSHGAVKNPLQTQQPTGNPDTPGMSSRDPRSTVVPMTKVTSADSPWSYSGVKSKLDKFVADEKTKRMAKAPHERQHKLAQAYQYGNTIIIEDEDGEVVKRYQLPTEHISTPGPAHGIRRFIGIGGAVKAQSGETSHQGGRRINWPGFGYGHAPDKHAAAERRKRAAVELEQEDDKHIRFRIGGEAGERMSKEAFITKVRGLDARTRARALHNSTASEPVKLAAAGLIPINPPPAPAATQPRIQGPSNQTSSSSDTTKVHSSSELPVSSAQVSAEADAEQDRGRPGPSTRAVVTESNTQDENLLTVPSLSQRKGKAKESEETSAERRRREAALGLTHTIDEDSDDDNTERVPPTRGIRWFDHSGDN